MESDPIEVDVAAADAFGRRVVKVPLPRAAGRPDRRPVPKEARCEIPECGARAFWWLWAEGHPRHKVCSECFEPLTAKLAGQASLIGRLRFEAIAR